MFLVLIAYLIGTNASTVIPRDVYPDGLTVAINSERVHVVEMNVSSDESVDVHAYPIAEARDVIPVAEARDVALIELSPLRRFFVADSRRVEPVIAERAEGDILMLNTVTVPAQVLTTYRFPRRLPLVAVMTCVLSVMLGLMVTFMKPDSLPLGIVFGSLGIFFILYICSLRC